MEDGATKEPSPGRSVRPIIAASIVVGALAIGSIGVFGLSGAPASNRSPSGTPGRTPVPSPIATSSVVASAGPIASQVVLGPDERALAAAYLGLAERFDSSSTDIQISDPLAEFDLVGTRLVDLLAQTGEQVAALPSSGSTDAVRDLGLEIKATEALLRAIDAHGPRDVAATQYRQALDYWIDHVKPVADAIRATFGLPATPAGDLRL